MSGDGRSRAGQIDGQGGPAGPADVGPESLERELFDLGRELSFPDTPDLLTPVRAGLEDAARGHMAGPWWARWEQPWSRPLRRGLVLAVAAVLALAGIVAGAFFGLGGLRIDVVETLPSVPPLASNAGPLGANLGLGQPMFLRQAASKVGFHVFVPAEGTYSDPTEVYYGLNLAGGQVSLVYAPADGRPDPAEGGVALLITEFKGQMQERLAQKSVGPGTTVEVLTVNGGVGFWIEGAPHVLVYRDPNGQFVHETMRLVRNSLAWEQDGTVLRIEGNVTREEALAIAASMRALDEP